MTSSNWLELGILLLVIATGTALWLFFKRKHRHYDGFEGIIEGKGTAPARNRMNIEEEIKHLESILKGK